jgi:hypothetical protein
MGKASERQGQQRKKRSPTQPKKSVLLSRWYSPGDCSIGPLPNATTKARHLHAALTSLQKTFPRFGANSLPDHHPGSTKSHCSRLNLASLLQSP